MALGARLPERCSHDRAELYSLLLDGTADRPRLDITVALGGLTTAAIAYLLGVGSEHDDFPAPIVEKFHSLVTPKGWSLCVDLLKFRLEMRAQKLGNSDKAGENVGGVE